MLDAITKRLSNLTLIISSIFLFAMMVHVSADVALKYVMNRPIPGTLEIVSAYYMVAGVFLPIAAVELTRSSIGVDVAYQYFPPWMKMLCMLMVLTGSTAVYFLLAYTSFGDAMRSFRIREVMMGNVMVSVWLSRFVLPISFGMAGLVCLYQLWTFLTDAQARANLMSIHPTEEDV